MRGGGEKKKKASKKERKRETQKKNGHGQGINRTLPIEKPSSIKRGGGQTKGSHSHVFPNCEKTTGFTVWREKHVGAERFLDRA